MTRFVRIISLATTAIAVGFLLIRLVPCAPLQAARTLTAKEPPYPASPVIESISWDFSTLLRKAPGSDLWPVTWAADNNLYTSWGDGGGFGGTNKVGRVSLGFARITGSPIGFEAENVWGGYNAENRATFKGKCAGLLSVDGVLYAWINMQNGHPPDIKLAWSSDYGAHWHLCGWEFSKKGNFFPGTFLNFGKDYADARDEYVYTYGGRWIWPDGPVNNVYLVRVRRDRIRDRAAYEFFQGTDPDGNPTWTSDVRGRKPVFSDPNGVGNGGGARVVFNQGIGRYILPIAHRSGKLLALDNEVPRLGIFDAPEPWGPWTTVAYYENWGGYGKGPALGYNFPSKWISVDGKTMWMVFSSTGQLDSFNLVKATLNLRNP